MGLAKACVGFRTLDVKTKRKEEKLSLVSCAFLFGACPPDFQNLPTNVCRIALRTLHLQVVHSNFLFKTMLNFRDEQLYINGERVNQLCVVGVAAERFWELAFCDGRGLGSLVWTDVTSVKLWDVTKKMSGGRLRRVGSAEVRLEPADSQMALGVAKAACERLEEMDYRILNAVLEQEDVDGNCVGAHDLVCERRQTLGKAGKTSVEVKLRRITTENLMLKMRRQVQVQAWRLWPAARADKSTAWAERLCLVVRWGPSDPFDLGDWQGMYAEVIPAEAATNAPEHWRPLCGWRGHAASAEARARAKAKAKAKAEAEAKAKAHSKHAFSQVYKKCRKAGKVDNGQEMRSISDLLNAANTQKAKRARPSIHERLPVWSKRFKWPPGSWAQDQACGSRGGGGTPGYVATQGALNDIFDEVRKS